VKHFSATRIRFVVLALSLCDTATAQSPWVSKRSADWDRNDVHRILYDSPWVKHVTRTKRDLEFEVPDQGPSGMELRGYHAKESKEDGAVTTEFCVRWVSSRTLRQAYARRVALIKQPGPEASEAAPPAAMDDFEIAIAGRDMSVFEGVREPTLKAKCYVATSSRPKIRPNKVEFARSRDGKIRGILFHFPRRTETGEPLISTHDEKVWFFEKGGDVGISVTFHPQMMLDGKGLDL
jgi:hypothetical protein